MDIKTSSSDVIVREIRDQCRAEIEAIEKQAESELSRRRQEAEQEMARIRDEILKKAQVQAEGIRRKVLSGLHLEIKRQRMNTGEVLISRILEKLNDKIEEFRKGRDYGPWLQNLVQEGIQALEGETIRIRASEIEKKLLDRETLSKIESRAKASGRSVKLVVDAEPLTEGGLLFLAENGRTRFDNRFRARIERLQDAMRLTVFKTLNLE